MKNILKTISILSILFTSCSKTDEVSDTIPSANENKILFSSDVNDVSHLYTMNVDGTNETKITNFTNGTNSVWGAGDASWSPDGTKIIFISDKDSDNDGGSEIYTINSDGTNLVRINHNARGESNPTWN